MSKTNNLSELAERAKKRAQTFSKAKSSTDVIIENQEFVFLKKQLYKQLGQRGFSYAR